MLNLYVSILLLFQTLTPTAASAEALKAPLDIAQIKNVAITGEASRRRIHHHRHPALVSCHDQHSIRLVFQLDFELVLQRVRNGLDHGGERSGFAHPCRQSRRGSASPIARCASAPTCQRTAMSASSSTRSMPDSPAIIAASASMAMRRTLRWMDMPQASMSQEMRSEPTYAWSGRTTTRRSCSIRMRSMHPSASAGIWQSAMP